MNTSTCVQLAYDYSNNKVNCRKLKFFCRHSFLRLIVAMLCLSLMLWLSPAVALADDFNQKADTISNNIYPDKSVEAFAAGTVVGGVAGGVGSVALVSTVGISGLSAAGMTSGLAAVGSLVGGGMAAGLAVAAALPVVVAGGVGLTVYTIYNIVAKPDQSVATSKPDNKPKSLSSVTSSQQ